MPSTEWLLETYPESCKSDSPTNIPDAMVDAMVARAWDRVLAEWDAGRLDVLYPSNHMLPWVALSRFMAWSKERGEAKQHELIGMSSGRKDASIRRAALIEGQAEE